MFQLCESRVTMHLRDTIAYPRLDMHVARQSGVCDLSNPHILFHVSFPPFGMTVWEVRCINTIIEKLIKARAALSRRFREIPRPSKMKKSSGSYRNAT